MTPVLEGECKVLLMHPPYYTLFNVDRRHEIPLGLLYIAAVLREGGYDVSVYNPDTLTSWLPRDLTKHQSQFDYSEYRRNLADPKGMAWVKLKSVLEEVKPDVVGVGFLTMSYTSAGRTVDIVKALNRNALLIGGGVGATIMPSETLDNAGFDYAVRGEGEHTMLELLDTLRDGGDMHKVKGVSFRDNGGIVHNPDREYIKNIDELPFPARDLLLQRGYYTPRDFGKIISSRGCPFDCNFCACRIAWGNTYRFRSPENVVDEIGRVHDTYGTRSFSFLDDTFYHDEERVLRICDLIEERGLQIKWNCLVRGININGEVIKRMKSVGLSDVDIGVESGSQRILDSMNKRIDLEGVKESIKLLKDLGVYIRANFIIGYPGETPETLEKTIELIKELDVEYVVEVFKPFHGTKAYEKLEQEGRLIHLPIDEHYDYYRQTFTTESIDYKQLVEQHKKLIQECLKQIEKKMAELRERLIRDEVECGDSNTQ
jgi:anaerobic magnesium-protoporphyrin IX monomethyl ester cyclase